MFSHFAKRGVAGGFLRGSSKRGGYGQKDSCNAELGATRQRSCAVGDTAESRRTFSSRDVQAFADLTSDHNPLHLDAAAAAKTIFGQRIVHGIFVHSMIAALLATELPGPGTIYLAQTLKFVAPVYLDEEIAAVVTVKERRRSIAVIETICRAVERDTVVIRGEATVKCSE